ncbi:hypothetical protein M0805_005914 [Coniferiporia weirii]|nr:hypothetical protein M0805_005914 [Coniferiporia weirii]
MWGTYPDDSTPQVLGSLDLPGIVKFMKSESCRNVFVMANLARLRLPYPEAVFDISFFKRNPRPFYVLAHELAPGKFRPTPTHSFIRLLAQKGLLHTCFTQNIDTLERAAGIPPDKIIEAHGSFADQHCIKCGAPYPHDKIKTKIEAQEIPICERRKCGGYVKPDIVFFGESLPDEFSAGVRHLRNADLLIVMGTSLTVHPFASLTELVPDGCPRLLLNLDHVGGWGSRVNDVACLMPCDRAVRELCSLLGWKDELEELWAETDLSPKEVRETGEEVGGTLPGRQEVSEESKDAAEAKLEDDPKNKPGDSEAKKKEVLSDIVDALAEIVGEVKLEDEASSVPEEGGAQDVGKTVSDGENNPSSAEPLNASACEVEDNSVAEEAREDSAEALHLTSESRESPSSSGGNLETESPAETGKL